MKIFPAIDLKGGRCVRLRQGRAEDETVYSSDPVATALEWQRKGAEFLHVVDLDGAFQGRPAHLDVFRALSSALSIPFEVGGGLRTDADVRTVLAAGATRVIIGSRAASDPDWAGALVKEHGDAAIVAGIDARDGFVQVSGWTQTTSVRAVDLARTLATRGVKEFIFTDTATDGMLQGPNLRSFSEMALSAPEAHFVASGGFHAPSDVAELAALGLPNVEGAIVGKALYEAPESIGAFLEAARKVAAK